MTVQVIYKNRANLANKGVFAVFTDENFKISKINKLLSKNEINFLTNILKSKSKKKNYFFRFKFWENTNFNFYKK